MQTTINQRIKFLVDHSKLSARKFSKELGVGETTTQNYLEPGNREPGARYLERLTKRFETIDARWLLTGEGEPFTSEAPMIYQPSQKNSGNIIGNITGDKNRITTLADCQLENAGLRKENEQLRSQLADKDHLIQSKQEIIDLLKQAK